MSPAAGSPLPQGRLPALDGVRGLALLMVLLVHFWRPETGTAVGRGMTRLAAMGWVGVDLFFVLSGFLITGVLLAAGNRQGTVGAFYARRILRIVPLYALFLAVAFVAMPRLTLALDIAAVPGLGYAADAEKWPWYAGFASNVWMAGAGRFSDAIAVSPTWSLAVEEQFYLVWPWLVLLCPRRFLVPLLVSLAGLAVASRAVLPALSPAEPWISAFVLTPCRLDALAAGSLLSVWLWRGELRRIRQAAAIGLGLAAPASLAWFLLLPGDPRQDGVFQLVGYSLVAVAALGLIAAVVGGQRHLGRILSARPLISLGRYSYAIYLFHLLIFTTLLPVFYRPVLKAAGSPLAERFAWLFLGTAACWLLGWFLERVFERHFLRLKRFFPMSAEAPFAAPPAAIPVSAP